MAAISDGKVKVARALNTGGAIGEIIPQVGMVTDYGNVVGTGNLPYVEVSGVGAAINRTLYAMDLTVTFAVASGSFGWPTDNGSVVYGHASLWGAGVPQDTNISQGVYLDQRGVPVTFDR